MPKPTKTTGARSVGSATISFGLVAVPIKLYSATESKSAIAFNMLHAGCGSRLKQQYVCAKADCACAATPIEKDQIAKGYEFSKDQYVTFTADELKSMAETATQVIEIVEFVPIEKIDAVFFEKAYYLAPDKGGAKGYSLLATAMIKSGRAALARYAARGKQFLVLVRPCGDGLVMQQLYYHDEVRSIADVPTERVDVRDAELNLAMRLIEASSSDDFQPQNYRDEVKDRIQAAIDQKVAGGEVPLVVVTAMPSPAVDLMAALEASLAGAKKPAKSARKADEATAEAA